MSVAHDLFAETNPAFCAYALVLFTSAYSSLNEQGPELPLVYLALPVALSGDLSKTFDGTNKNTGLLEWLERSPQAQVGLVDRINGSLGIVTDAVRFSCFSHLMALNDGARLKRGRQHIKKSVIASLSEGPAQALKRAERLGYWFASAGSTKTVFDIMGLTL